MLKFSLSLYRYLWRKFLFSVVNYIGGVPAFPHAKLSGQQAELQGGTLDTGLALFSNLPS